MSLRGYSQKVILNEKKDTMICETQSLLKDTILSNKEKEITALKMIYDNTNTMLKLKEYEIDKLKQSLQLANDEARKQKRHKWFFIGTTAVVSLFTGYYVLTH
jgi:hypothetical protein